MKRTLHAVLIAWVIAAFAVAAVAQTNATIRGTVRNATGNPLADAEVNAVNTANGFVQTVHSRADGTFLLSIPGGTYNLVVAATGYEPRTDTLTVQVGQSLPLDLRLTPTAVVTESITVVGNTAVETKTSEIATNVTRQQIENLPQDDRNFLNFATMAPGIRMSTDPTRKVIAGDAQDPEATNVFIDGVSTKNDVLLGGTSGQDSSRGNPFPQSAVQEFRVITQNYSAQYDHASSAIITAVTKSGTNDFIGQAFGYWQPKQWVSATAKNFGFNTLTNNAAYHRLQSGLNFGGPIIRDKLNFFLDYEGDDEHATTPVGIPSQFASQFGQFAGIFSSPFKSTLLFGKMSWQPSSSQLLDFSGNYRREHETRDFGGGTTFQSATDLRNWVEGGNIRHQWNNASALNEITLAMSRYGWNPTPLNPTEVGLNFFGCCRLGGNSTTQEFDQRRIELRDNYSFAPMNLFMGQHSFMIGGNADWMHYRVNKSLFGNPEFDFENNTGAGHSFAGCTTSNIGTAQCFPFQAQFGFGNPIFSTSNNEYGVFGQDNWTVNNHLTLNLGLRWDYETHMLDENFVTPANIVAALKGKTFQGPNGPVTIPDEFFSNGNQRSPYKDELQPRLGFSYDIFGDSKTVAFGGWGRYFDRLYLNSTLDERFRLQYPVYNIHFSADGSNGTIKWDPSFLTVAGLNSLIASGQAHPEIHLLSNNTKPPYSNQWNIGIRQAFAGWLAQASYDAVRGYRGITWVSASGTCCNAFAPGYGAVILSDPVGKQYWYSGESLTLDRPFTHLTNMGWATGWGVHLVYTHSKAEQTGNDLFSLDLPSAADYARHPVNGSQPNNFVATGMLGLPWQIMFSTNINIGSGPAVDVFDFSQGFDLPSRLKTGVINRAVYPSGGFKTVDFRLSKDFPLVGRTSVGLIGEIFNAFNSTNYGCLTNFLGPGDNPANLGQANCVVSLGRREQVGVRVNF